MRVLFVANSDGAIFNFRFDLIQDLVKDHEVYVLSGESYEGSYREELSNLGISDLCYVRVPKSLNEVFFLIKSSATLIHFSKEKKINITLAYTHFGNFISILASIFSGSKVICTITGLGRLFSHDQFHYRVGQRLLLYFYRFFSFRIAALYVQNHDDYKVMVNAGFPEKKCKLVNGSGFNPRSLVIKETPQKSPVLKVIFIGRHAEEKGIIDYINAASMVKLVSDKFEFYSAGIATKDFVKQNFEGNKDIQYLGYIDDIHKQLVNYDVIAFPSYYREGVPRSIIEALFYGKCIITCDTPGNRETVIDSWNGYFCEPKNPNSLAEKILLCDRAFIKQCFTNSRLLANQKFDVAHIIKEMRREIDLIIKSF